MSNMKKVNLFFKAIAFLLVLMASQAMRAEEEICLVVTETSGAQTYFALSAFPEITIGDGALSVATEETGITVALEDFDHYAFADHETTMVGKAVLTEGGGTSFRAGMAFVSGLRPGDTVSVCTVDGRQVSSTTASQSGEAVVDLSGLKAGTVHILRTPSASYKIINK